MQKTIPFRHFCAVGRRRENDEGNDRTIQLTEDQIMKQIGIGRIFGLAIAALLLTVSTVFAQGRGHGDHDGRKGHIRAAFAQLDLTDDQKVQLKELHEAFREENQDLHGQMKELREQMREQAKAGDREAAAETREQLAELREQMKERAEGMKERMAAILTPEQVAQLEEMREKHEARRDERKDKRSDRAKCRGKKGDLAEKLDLSDDQKAKIAAIREEFKADNADELAAIKELKDQAKEQFRSGDREGARETMGEIREIAEGLKDEKQAMHEAIKNVLTPEQQAIVAEMMEKKKECRDKKRGDRVRGDRGVRDVETEDRVDTNEFDFSDAL